MTARNRRKEGGKVSQKNGEENKGTYGIRREWAIKASYFKIYRTENKNTEKAPNISVRNR